jgi:hypothetical protein
MRTVREVSAHHLQTKRKLRTRNARSCLSGSTSIYINHIARTRRSAGAHASSSHKNPMSITGRKAKNTNLRKAKKVTQIGDEDHEARYVSNVSIIFDAPCLFLHHLLSVSLHFMAFLCIFRN